ncbi:MAG: flagellar hook-associated protein FlgL [Caldilineaceae bacterium]|nr:flagellar hook-associated protein FlgL [Caldilineaceae bacterium]HRJ41796.1 flagellar hook-associated protein FlgL [Caldilineaceae bacterium]
MRITDRMAIDHTIYQLQQGRQRLGEAQEKVATGRRLLRSSDGPADVERAMTLNSELSTVQNQVSNLGTTRDWLNGTDVALESFNDLIITARNLALRASSDSNSERELAAMSGEVGGLLENALAIANTSQGGYYLFAGHQVKTQPFIEEGSAIIYQGDNQEIRHQVELGQTMPVNVTGVAGDNGGILNGLTRLKELKLAMENNDKEGVRAFLTQSEEVSADMYVGQSSVGARLQRVDRTSARLQQREIDLKQLYSHLVDADMATTISELNAEQQGYEMTLAASGRTLPRSLMDYIR